jgi:hypothetical protein
LILRRMSGVACSPENGKLSQISAVNVLLP